MAAVGEMSAADRKKLKVQELRDVLGEMGLDTTGTKPVLLERLEEAIAATDPKEEPAAEEAKEKATPTADVTPKAEGAAKESAEKKKEVDAAADGNLEEEPLLEDVPVDEAVETADEESELEKRKKRAARFGIELSMQDKVEIRKQRFESTEKPAAAATTTKPDATPEPEVSEEEKLKREQRMKRFGLERSGIEELRLQREAKKARRAGGGGRRGRDLKAKKMKDGSDNGTAPSAAIKPTVVDSEWQAKILARAKRFAT